MSILTSFLFSRFGHVIGLALIAAVEVLKAKHPEFAGAIDGLLPQFLEILGLGFLVQSKPLIGGGK